jgi:hypothetical protein
MANPYSQLPDHRFWRRAITNVAPDDVDPVTSTPFQITLSDKVATAGSCFAQHLSRMLVEHGFHFLVTEAAPPDSADQENYGIFSAASGNIYTVRQLLQLFNRAYGVFRPVDKAWTRADGLLIDPFRPQIRKSGYSTAKELETDRSRHLGCVRRVFEECDVFVFTLGLTEGWISEADGAVFPLAPGVVGSGHGRYRFENFSVESMVADLTAFIDRLRTVNRSARVILTVSPVPLIATYEKHHVLVSTTYSKAALRVVADLVSRCRDDVAYFPSYEIITGSHTRGRYFEADLRTVTAAGVAQVMKVFARHFLGTGARPVVSPLMDESAGPAIDMLSAPTASAAETAARVRTDERLRAVARIVCDEEALEAGPK